MTDTTQLKAPLTCTEAERGEFARLVRQGFHGSDEGLPDRIRQWPEKAGAGVDKKPQRGDYHQLWASARRQ